MRVWHLFSHRAGLPGNSDLDQARPLTSKAAVAGLPESDPRNPRATLEKVVEGWVKEGLLAEPGARFAYGGAGYMVAARMAEVVLGQRFERLLQEALLHPLKMKHTTFRPDGATMRALPARYVSTPDGPKRDTRVMPFPQADRMINPAGGLCSRLDDLAAFLALHANRGMVGERRLVSAESLARMYRPHPPRAREAAEGGGAGYGLGWNVVAPGGVARHLGATGTMAWLDLKAGHAGMLLTQVKWGAAKPLVARLMKEVQAIFPAKTEPATAAIR
jgi:CubicO group peptidase (beta-lactamase class C family)